VVPGFDRLFKVHRRPGSDDDPDWRDDDSHCYYDDSDSEIYWGDDDSSDDWTIHDTYEHTGKEIVL
jgi:hypothetical protein